MRLNQHFLVSIIIGAFSVGHALNYSEVLGAEKKIKQEKIAVELDENLVMYQQADLAQEKIINDALKKALQTRQTSHLILDVDKQWIDISPRQAALSGLQKNYSVLKTKLSQDVADAAYQEAKALFDPLLTFTFLFTHTKKHSRLERILKYKGETTAVAKGDANPADATICDPVNNDDTTDTNCHRRIIPEGILAYVQFDRFRPAGFADERIDASTKDITESPTKQDIKFNIKQKLPWGAEFTLGWQTLYQDAFFVNNADAAEAGVASFGSYGRPWTTTLSAAMLTSFPFAKEFGQYSSTNVRVSVAKRQQDKAKKTVISSINKTLLQLDAAYWQLVKATYDLYSTIENKKNIAALVKKTQRLYTKRLKTAYAKSQIEAEFSRIKGQEEIEWNNLTQASNTLKKLLDDDNQNQGILIPAGYAGLLHQEDPVIQEDIKKSLVQNPDIQAKQIDLEIADINLKASNIAKRPNVNFVMSATAGQLNSVFGYAEIHESWEKMINPDRVSLFSSLNYRYPWHNRSAKVNYKINQLSLETQKLLLKSTKKQVERTYKDAMMALFSAEKRTELTKKNYRLALNTYNKGVDQLNLGNITEYEVIVKNTDLLNANKSWVRAMIDKKIAESKLLSAKGVLAEQYAQRTAQTSLDRYRLQKLADNKLLRYFE